MSAHPEELVRDLTGAVVDDDLARAIGHGRVVERAGLGVVGDGPWPVFDNGGRLVAVCEPVGRERVKPVVVVRASDGSGVGVGSASGDD